MRVQTPSHSSALRAEFKIRDPAEQLDVDSTIQPVAIVADLSGQTVAWLGYPRAAMGTINSPTGGVGTNCQCIARAPSSRGLIYHVTRCYVAKVTSGNLQFRVSAGAAAPAAVTPTATKAFVDQRVRKAPDLIIEENTPLTAALEGTHVGSMNFAVAEGDLWPINVVLGANDWILFANETADEGFRCTFWWTEYLLEDR